MKVRLGTFLFALAVSSIALAQEKPVPSQEKAARSTPSSFATEQQWEAEAHTTDCSKAPTLVMQADCGHAHFQVRTVNLVNASSQNDANEILVAARNISDPQTKLFLLSNQNVITIGTYPQDLDRIEAYIHSVDRPHRIYKLTFTLVDSDSGKRLGIEHYSLTVVSGQRTTMKEGSKVPIVTGSSGSEGTGAQQQVQYLDVGLSFDATVSQVGPNLQLKTKVEQSSLGEPRAAFGERDPVIRQAVYEGVSIIVPGKPMTLGSLDLPGSTRHLDIEVLAEPIS